MLYVILVYAHSMETVPSCDSGWEYWHPPRKAGIVFVGKVVWPRLCLWLVSHLIPKSVYEDMQVRILLGLNRVFEPDERIL